MKNIPLSKEVNLKKQPLLKYYHIFSYFSKKQNGLSIVEFAIILPLFLFLVFGIIEFGVLMYDKTVLTNASRTAARLACLYQYPRQTKTQIEDGTLIVVLENDTEKSLKTWIEQYCTNRLISFKPGDVFSFENNVSISLNESGPTTGKVDSGELISVGIDYDFQFLVLSSLLDGITLKAISVMRAE